MSILTTNEVCSLEKKLQRSEYQKNYKKFHNNEYQSRLKEIEEKLRNISLYCIPDENIRQQIKSLKDRLPKRGRPKILEIDMEEYIRKHNVQVEEITISQELLNDFERVVSIKETELARRKRYAEKKQDYYREYGRQYYKQKVKKAKSLEENPTSSP